MQHGVDGGRVGIQVQQGAHTGDHLGQGGQQAVAGGERHAEAGLIFGVEPGIDPARVLHAAHGQPHRAAQALRVHAFHAVDLARGQKAQQRRRVVRRAQPQVHGAGRARVRAALAAQLRGVEPVVRAEGSIEAPHAGEAAGQRHLGDGQARVGQQLLGRQQPARLQVLQRRHAQGRLEDAAQVPVAHAQAVGQLRHQGAAAVGAPGLGRIQQAQRLAHEDARGVLHRPRQRLRRQLGPAAQAGPEARALGLRGEREEAAVLAPRRAHGADRAAVDAGGGHAREETPVEARVARLQSEVAGVVIVGGNVGGHGTHDRPRTGANSPFPDMCLQGLTALRWRSWRQRRSPPQVPGQGAAWPG